MIFLNEKRFAKFNDANGRTLENSFVYMLSKSLAILESGENMLVGNDKLITLRPSDELLKKLKNGEIGRKQFRKDYYDELSSDENRFIIYTIIRSLNEKRYLPIFICSDEDWELGFMKLLSKFFTKKYGIKPIDAKQYQKEVKSLWKAAKRGNNKKKAARKEFRRSIKGYIKDQVQLSFKGLERLESMEKEFAIDRIVILLNQAADDADDISKKDIIKAIKSFSDFSKKAKKAVKAAVMELGISKKSSRWSRPDAINLSIQVYNKIHNLTAADKKN